MAGSQDDSIQWPGIAVNSESEFARFWHANPIGLPQNTKIAE